MTTYDVTVVGAGPGGYVAAIRAAQGGAAVALVEKEHLGGTCLNWGCIPTKTLIANADVLDTVRRASHFGVRLQGEATVDWPAMVARKNKVVTTLRGGIAALVKSQGITVVTGRAALTGRDRLVVTAADGTRSELRTKAIILATGSTSVMPRFLPQAPTVIDSRAALDLPALPDSVIVLGGGVIGCEFACLYARLGVRVTLVEMLPEILPTQDAEVVRTVRREMKKLGIEVVTGSRVEAVQADGHGVRATVGESFLTAACLLAAVGRRPCSDGLDLAAAGLAPDARGLVAVDARCRTRVPGIYAIGDLAGTIQFAHRASSMGLCAAANATGETATHDDRLVPSCIFTSPEIGSVGLTEAAAREQGREIRVGRFPFQALGKAQAMGETTGMCKIVADAATDQVLGVHIVGPHATDLVAEAVTAMRLEITARELAATMHAHPTLAETLMEAAHAVHDACVHLPRQKRTA
jgi:dihydrolipoamide dehydrogenase